MRRTRILIARMPRMLSDLVHAVIGADGEAEIAGGDVDEDDVVGAIALTDADVLLVGCESEAHATPWLAVLWQYPHLRLLALEHDGRRALLFELRPQRTVIGELSPAALRGALHATAPGRVA